jgi:16S rRNA (adenine1518-N6/adenine1519-N6)-dimethyltransferase
MQTLSDIRQLLSERGLRPRKRFGQNFLHDQNQIRRLIEAADVKSGELVLEVGPGTGALTEALLDRGAIDRDLAAILHERLGERIKLIVGDCLKGQRELSEDVVAAMGSRSFKLIANLPYQIASPLMAALLMDHLNCIGQFVTIQKEVADRLMAQPRTKEYGPLSIIVQALARVERIGTLSPSCFWPAPDVTSAMVSIIPRGTSELPQPSREFARFITDLFTKRRKQLGTILGRDRTNWPRGVTADLRPEALDVGQLIELWKSSR